MVTQALYNIRETDLDPIGLAEFLQHKSTSAQQFFSIHFDHTISRLCSRSGSGVDLVLVLILALASVLVLVLVSVLVFGKHHDQSA